MFELGILDASALVYTGTLSAGHEGSSYGSDTYYGYPVGGIHYFLKYLSIVLKDYDDVIIVFDSKKNFRKDLDGTYKENRSVNKVVVSQLEHLYNGLMECGFRCHRLEGYEGDDLINWAVQQNVGKFNAVKIYGNDRDLIHNVQNKVSFRPIRADMNYVDVTNFSKAIYKDKSILFNTLNAYKVFCGCPSDNVKPFISDGGQKGQYFYNLYTQLFLQGVVPKTYENTASKVLLSNFLSQVPELTEHDLQVLDTRIKIIFPADCPEGVLMDTSSLDTIDQKGFAHFLTLYHAFEALRCLELRKVMLEKEDIEFLKNEARALLSGEFCVDNNLPVNVEPPAAHSLFLKEF